ncbi:hypothetical protein FKY96_14375 [Enterococcus faecalis]|nr:hypothetical protein FKZ03_13975 [Enterococcus faecalis]TQB31364.1 hypothetical protein FKY96_14375 [Enterococcus faecalis]TQB59821.1 hypothetical protein FKZ15_15155 [Enterococcus faecalis]
MLPHYFVSMFHVPRLAKGIGKEGNKNKWKNV